ncbi:hypothetical protein LUZ60_005577 [Juncus effusus]|nr:hypothetical protein LUZ60_005577 [Juncus effusus]
MGIQLYSAGGGAAVEMGPRKCLRRLPHVFNRVLELPFTADADVSIYNCADSYRFVAASAGLRSDLVRPHLIRIHPGVIKLLVGEQGVVRDDMELNRWRFRLPESTQPELASVFCENGQLVVIVPKAVNHGMGEREGVWNIGIDIRLVTVQ